eukprot:TRINITY_DN28033_c0_g2_i3.p1 TRINITY_DN28033_c0_g2~~TRINITY_DN28033_c0_g2_i3.p1  ORF type:complete len:822 (+),score=166.05 TRINITY_DN28033_c0_g2_i3:30-2468(+)
MENFALEDGNTFQAACPFNSDMPENNTLLQEKLSHYLDIVEVQLVKEISLRSDSFFEAQGQLQDLNGKLVAAFAKLRELKDTVKLLDADLVQNARQIQTLSRTRAGLVSLHEKLKLISYVYQSLSALKLLISAADCASALDVIDDLQQVQENNDLVGLHCFRHLSNQLASSLEAVNNILAADFVRVAIHDAKNLESTIIATFRVGEKDIVSIAEEDILLKIKSVDDPSSGLRDRLLPLVIGLLRTAKLPAVLRVYRDTLIADIKASIITTVAELLPLLLMQASECEVPLADRQADRDGGGSSMASKLRSLSAQSFVWLLTAIFRVVQMHLIHAAEIKKVIEWIMGGLDGYYAADAVAAAFSSGVAIARAAEASHESDRSLLSHFSVPPQHSQTHVNLPMVKNDVASPSSVSRNFRADVLRENTEAVLAACDAAHARWAKLLGVRALVHPKLRLQDFLSIYNISQEFLSATEKVGGRLGYSIRGSLQSQCKAFIDYQHTLRVTKLSAVLDQETWVAVDVPNEFQAIVYSFGFNECSGDNGSQLVSDSIIDNVNGQSAFDQNANQVENVSRQGETEENSMQSETAGRLRKGRDKSTVKTLSYQGIGYHMVNSGIILLKMISEYIDIANALPNFASDVVHRVADILKHFNSRTCHLVLGAGAMQVSRLKSITAKHLALASQTISFFHAIIPDVKRILLLHIPEVHKTVLVSDIDKIQQDYKVHRDEIHLKLVQIMKERLQVHLRMMPQIVESWNKQEDKELQPSQIARNLTKEVGVLQRVISPILHEMDVQMIFSFYPDKSSRIFMCRSQMLFQK